MMLRLRLILLHLSRKAICTSSANNALTEKEIQIILFLNNENKEQTISDLQKNVWGHSSKLDTHTVETHIYRLRKKINDCFDDEKFIINFNNGYKIQKLS